MTPQITIGIPVYNALPWLKESIQSVLAQTVSDFEVLIIDDGSTDGTWEFLCSIHDPRIRVLRQENRGITQTLNRMLDEIRTPWLMRLDGDDVVMPNRVERVCGAIRQHPNAGLLYSGASHYQHGRFWGQLKTTVGDPEKLREITRSGYLLAINHSSVTLNVEKAKAAGGYRFDLNVEEYDLFWRMALQYRVIYIPETLVGYRINAGGVSFRDLRSQAINLLYVQYLLLSHLWNLSPRSYDEVNEPLEALLDKKTMKFTTTMRRCYAAIGGRRYSLALATLFQVFCNTPWLLTLRLLYQFGVRGQPRVGVDPGKFRALSAELWPGVNSLTS
jgi:glycosyltransferase involved in cell wall biosynthesis